MGIEQHYEEVSSGMIRAPKILIIDDSITLCILMERILRTQGYQVLVATDGREGLALAVQEQPDCLILDIVLPGLSGFEICRQLRNRNLLQNFPVIMVSSKSTALDKSWALRQGASYYLVKPFQEEEFVNIVKHVLAGYIHPAVPKNQPPAPQQMPPDPMPATHQPSPSQFSRRQQIPFQRIVTDARDTPGSIPINRPQPHFTREVPAYRPEASRPAPTPQYRSAEQKTPSLLSHLVPQRLDDVDVSKIRSTSLFTTDKQVRRLYEAIDGRMNVEKLCVTTRLSIQEATRALRHLLVQRSIRLCEPDGNVVNNSRFLSELL